MAIDTFLLDRLRNLLESKKITWIEKKMFGGICFMIDDKMAFGTFKDGLMFRIDPLEVDLLTQKEEVDQMQMNGRIMIGYLKVSPFGYDSEDDLSFWINKSLEFNPKAKSSKKK